MGSEAVRPRMGYVELLPEEKLLAREGFWRAARSASKILL